MFIAVISDIYVGVHREHKDFWERHMTSLLIKDIIGRHSSTTGDLLAQLISVILRATFLSRVIRWYRRRKARKHFEDELLAGISDGDYSESSEDSLFDDSDISHDTNEKLKEIGSKILRDEEITEIAVQVQKKNRMLFFSDEQIEKLVYQFFLKRSVSSQVGICGD
jgi:hypothetical protein